ncbi:MAG: hypothetical protein II969_11650 [Anaerolineaceae bacterium]|nr:hypothetical protein [Anaerolineaceae bacterium]
MALLTTEEAKLLIEELKKYADQAALDFPNREKRKLRFDVFGEKRGHEFIINIEKKPYNPQGYTWQGRYNRDNTILLRLDINPSSRHVNPGTDEVIVGSHLHIYTEEFEDRYAVPFDTGNKFLSQICMEFFEQFHVIEPPHFLYKPELESHV